MANLMFKPYEPLTRLALNLVEPYTHGPTGSTDPTGTKGAAGEGNAPSSQIWPYIKSHLSPLRKVLALSVLITIFSASVEVWLIG